MTRRLESLLLLLACAYAVSAVPVVDLRAMGLMLALLVGPDVLLGLLQRVSAEELDGVRFSTYALAGPALGHVAAVGIALSLDGWWLDAAYGAFIVNGVRSLPLPFTAGGAALHTTVLSEWSTMRQHAGWGAMVILVGVVFGMSVLPLVAGIAAASGVAYAATRTARTHLAPRFSPVGARARIGLLTLQGLLVAWFVGDTWLN